jgi:putative hydrolase of the HAD superfamily
MPRLFVFDAVHTFLRPVPDVLTAYFDAGRLHGSELSKEKIKTRFRIARRSRFSTGIPSHQTQPGSLRSSDAIELQLWRDLISDVFTEIKPVDSLFERLWEHFALPENWQLYDDVAACWSKLHANGDRIIVASNFDSRLHAIMENFEELAIADAVYCSAEVGYRKPDPLFYETVSKSFGIAESDEVIMIGDDFENDYVAPKRFGWKAIHLDRKLKYHRKSHVISSLHELHTSTS